MNIRKLELGRSNRVLNAMEAGIHRLMKTAKTSEQSTPWKSLVDYMKNNNVTVKTLQGYIAWLSMKPENRQALQDFINKKGYDKKRIVDEEVLDSLANFLYQNEDIQKDFVKAVQSNWGLSSTTKDTLIGALNWRLDQIRQQQNRAQSVPPQAQAARRIRRDEWSVFDDYLKDVKVPISTLLEHVKNTGQLDQNVFQQLKKTLYETYGYQPDQIVTADVVDRIIDFSVANPQVENAFRVALQNVPENIMSNGTKDWIAEKVERRLNQARVRAARQQGLLQPGNAGSQTQLTNASGQVQPNQRLPGGSSTATPPPSQASPTQDQDIRKRLAVLHQEQIIDGTTQTIYYDRDKDCFWIALKTADGSEQWYWAKSGVPDPTRSSSISLEQIEQSGNVTLYRDNRGYYWTRDKEGRWHLFSGVMSNPDYTTYDPKKALANVSESDLAKSIGGYATLPLLLALISSFFTDEPYIPILLGLAGLGIAHFYPEVREKINLANLLPPLEGRSQELQSTAGGPTQSKIRDQAVAAGTQRRTAQRAVVDQTELAGIQGQNEQPAAAGQGQQPAVS